MIDDPEEITPGLFEIRDIKDYPILFSAISDGNIDVLITNDKDYDDLKAKIDKPEIMKPVEFFDKY